MSGWTDYQKYLREAVINAIGADSELTVTTGTLGIKANVALPPTKDPNTVEVYKAEFPFIGTRVTKASGCEVIGSNAYIHPMRVRVYAAVRQAPAEDGLALLTRIQTRVEYVLSRLNGSVLNSTTQVFLAGPMDAMEPRVSDSDEFLIVADVVAVFNALRCD